MKVTISDPSLPGAALRERGTGGDAQHMRWRAELERAQWQARLRYSPASGTARGVAGEPPAARDAIAQAPRGGAAAGALAAGQRMAPPPARAASLPSRAQAEQPLQPAPAFTTEPLAAALPAPAALRGQALAARAPANRAAMPQLLFELPQWPVRTSQVCLQGKRLSVVLRDEQLAAGEAQALRAQLHAQCAACGLELADLTINGVSVEPAAPVE